jgi:hypothetical protein
VVGEKRRMRGEKWWSRKRAVLWVVVGEKRMRSEWCGW